jgi:hypothetical protein
MRTLFTVFFGLAVGCQAGPIFTVTFSPSIVSGTPGSALGFFGTLLNNTANTEFINSDSFTLAGIPAASVDVSPFLNNAPLSLGPNASTGSFLFLTVTIPNNQAAADYPGTFNVLGGQDGGAGTAQNNLGTGTFTTRVNAAATPEPASGLLIGAGLLALWLWGQRRLRTGGSTTSV